MGKKQRNKKAAAAAAAVKTKAAAENTSSSNNNNNTGNSNGGSETDIINQARSYRESLKKLMDLAQNGPSTSISANRKSTSSTSEGGSTTDSDDMPELEDVLEQKNLLEAQGAKSELPNEFVTIAKQSRGEKKARRLLMKLDLKPLENVSRVTMLKSKKILLYIDRPDVFKCPHTDTYICFGDIRVEDISSAAATQAAERYRMPELGESLQETTNELLLGKSLLVDDDKGEDVDAEGLDEKDIELVQMQASCSRKSAIKALLKNENDVVNAIMELTVS